MIEIIQGMVGHTERRNVLMKSREGFIQAVMLELRFERWLGLSSAVPSYSLL